MSIFRSKRARPDFGWDDVPDTQGDFHQLNAFYQTINVSAGDYFIGELFNRKFGSAAPDFGHHWVSFYKPKTGIFVPVNYIHARRYGPVVLIGGAVTDSNALRAMSKKHRQLIRVAGGSYYVGLRNVFHEMMGSCEAFFGYVGDSRAYKIDIAAGFRDTEHKYLVAYFPHPVSQKRREELIQRVSRLGPF